ncbi:RHS repeat domain-containing protein [Chryseobacterium wanjuense]
MAITRSDGAVIEKRYFDAWGNLKSFVNQQGELITDINNLMSGNIFLDRGYTGHEHVWRAGVIDMNARIYDPIMRRFLSPDMLIQDKYNTQNYNRYGYVFNNPLIYNDPSGYAALETAIIAVAVAIVTKAFVNWINHVPIWYGLGKTFTIAVGSAIISYGIGSVATDLFSTTVTIGKAAFQAGMHGLSGGFFSELNGGKFVTGMLSSATASLVGSGMEAWGQSSSTIEIISPEDGLGIVTTFAERNQDLMTALTLVSGGLSGGFSSTIAGGNFWDGLKQGVLVVGLNHLGHFAFNFNKLERFLLKNGVTKEKMEAPATKDDIELLNKIFKVQYYDKSAKWVKMADEKTLQEWAEGYIEYVETPNGALKYKGAPQTDKPAYAVTNPINGRIIIGTGIANLNFLYFAKAYIHEMVHSINAMELIAAGKVPVADDYFDEIEAYLTEADWQGYLPKGIEPYLKQATQLFLFINNR